MDEKQVPRHRAVTERAVVVHRRRVHHLAAMSTIEKIVRVFPWLVRVKEEQVGPVEAGEVSLGADSLDES